MLQRLDTAFGEFIALTRKVEEQNLWQTSFLDMVCEPPETFTYGGMIAHVITFSAYRRTAVIEAFEHFKSRTLALATRSNGKDLKPGELKCKRKAVPSGRLFVFIPISNWGGRGIF